MQEKCSNNSINLIKQSPLHIHFENCMVGNNAMACALLLYYHIARSNGFTGDETVFIDPEQFTGWRFLDVCVDENLQPDIDQRFLREAAVIYLLCDLNDLLIEYDDSFYNFAPVQKFTSACEAGALSAIPETNQLLAVLQCTKTDFNRLAYQDILQTIYDKYVGSTFIRLSGAYT